MGKPTQTFVKKAHFLMEKGVNSRADRLEKAHILAKTSYTRKKIMRKINNSWQIFYMWEWHNVDIAKGLVFNDLRPSQL